MLWIIIGVQFLLTVASYVRWLRVAQQSGYARGGIRAAMRQHIDGARGERVVFIIVVVVAALGTLFWPLAFVGAVLWFQWPRSLPYVDKADPLVWDAAATRVATVMVLLHIVAFVVTFVLTFVLGLYMISLLTLMTITMGELAVRIARPRAVTA